MKNKFFIITIDTEADNQWDSNQPCTTNNAKFLPRFQLLAEKFGYKPVYLTTYEMANDSYFVKYFKEKQRKNLCEIGMHLHAWNTPPYYELNHVTKERSYLIEYPKHIMKEKIENLDAFLTKKFGLKPITHRAGRWVMNENYFELLDECGYKVDCSVTPHISWNQLPGESGVLGSDYKQENETPNYKGNVVEIPLTIKKIRCLNLKGNKTIKSFLKNVYHFLTSRYQWIRPGNEFGLKGMKKVVDICSHNNEYIMFMIHSSELMPGGSPNFQTEDDIEKLFQDIEELFKYAKNAGYEGITLRDYYKILLEKNMIEKEKK